MPSRIANILLVSANKMTNPYPVYPLGLAFLQASLENSGYAVRIWDQLLHAESDLVDHLDWAHAVGISLRNVDNVSSSSPVGYIDEHKALVAKIRDVSPVPIILGGSAFSIFPEEFMQFLQADWGIQGEAESAIVQLLDGWNQGSPVAAIPGLVLRNPDGSIHINPPGMIPADEIPSPRPDPGLIRSYLELGGMLNAQTQRGCPLKCTYCTYPWIEGKRYRHRNPDDLVAELAHLQQHGAKYVFFTDSVFNTSNRHIEGICRAILKAGLKLEWGCFARPKNISSELLDQMIASGMRHLEFGSDSFCPATLQSYGKSFSFDEILHASEIAASKKVHTCHYIIFGGPGETESTILETVENSKRLPDAPIFAFSGMRIYPHTPLVEASGTTLSNSELVSPVFYKPDSLPESRREHIIREATAGLPNWYLSDHADDNAALTTRLRKKGKQGPLWEYLAISRRLRPS